MKAELTWKTGENKEKEQDTGKKRLTKLKNATMSIKQRETKRGKQDSH